jgi:GNAT superfamily N-acetyltransferase
MTPTVPEGVLSRRGGRPCRPVPFTGRMLGAADVDDVIALHHVACLGVPREVLARESDAFFAAHVERIGRILGLYAEGKLIAYGVLGLPGSHDASFADELGLPAAVRARAANIDGVSVTPEWRGNGLHQLLIAWRLQWAVGAGRTVALSTVAPANLPSLRNLLAEGLTIRAIRQKFGGTRYIVRRDLDRPRPEIPRRGRWIPVKDLETQSAALERGDLGWTLREGRSSLWYGAPPDSD